MSSNRFKTTSAKEVVCFFVLLILLVGWMGFIFLMSANTGEESQGLSDKIALFLASLFWPNFDTSNASEQAEILSSLSFPLRKTAHFSEYAILGLLALAVFVQGRALWTHRAVFPLSDSFVKPVIGAVVLSFIYACFDEFHQLFVDGRSGQPFDVMIDSFGALFAVIIATVLLVRKAKRNPKATK